MQEVIVPAFAAPKSSKKSAKQSPFGKASDEELLSGEWTAHHAIAGRPVRTPLRVAANHCGENRKPKT
ncbi:MAG: hypothetical protein K2X38_24170 [Gemmataceae bacterium]|nr:hypothetical protein [Gemmataceae bacterium]